MGQREKLLDRWLNNTPQTAPVSEVEAILKYFFKDRFRQKGSSHIVIRDERLHSADFGLLGEFSIPVSGGQRVKGLYLRRLAQIIQIIEE